MALFRRNKSVDTGVPEEVSNYYQSESRDRTWMAWLLALVTLAVTAIVVIGLFFGGRWVYRKVRHTTPTSAPVATEQPSQTAQAPASPQSNPSTPSGSTSTNGTVTAPTNPSSSATSSSSPTSTSPPAAATTPAASAPSTNLPNTGPGNIVAVFMAISLLTYVLHRRLAKD